MVRVWVAIFRGACAQQMFALIGYIRVIRAAAGVRVEDGQRLSCRSRLTIS